MQSADLFLKQLTFTNAMSTKNLQKLRCRNGTGGATPPSGVATLWIQLHWPRKFGRRSGTFGATPPTGVATVWIQLASSHGGYPWGDLAVRGGALFNQGQGR